jgi:hypothetical protein
MPTMARIINRLRRRALRLTAEARAEVQRDRNGLAPDDPGVDAALTAAVQWLCRAQDRSATADGGVARGTQRADLEERSRRMLDWLADIQLESGAFQGGPVDARPAVPVTFNTGQILLGLAASEVAFGRTYIEAMHRAGDWLVETQDPDGCWRRYPTPFAAPGEKVYETHVAWGMLEAARVTPSRGYGEAALANIDWALTHQAPNGWFTHCCLTDPERPLTHTLGYALRGIIEGYRYAQDQRLLSAAQLTADGLLGAIRADGFVPGRLRADWSPAVEWSCLTGSVQIASCWLLLYQETADRRYRDAALTVNRFVRRTVRLDAAPDVRGGVKGSFPVSGEYGAYEYLNWAAKFFVDAMLLEKDVRETRA